MSEMVEAFPGSSDPVDELWPRRLLYLPTLTSYERTANSTYGSVKNPKYSILSYTWGRFRDDSGGPVLPVKGITWRIPAVEGTTFSVEEFQGIISTLQSKHEWAWIDVACIDQDNVAMKMEEVGRQAGIFKNATDCFVWLHKRPALELQCLLEKIAQDRAHLRRQFLDREDSMTCRHPKSSVGCILSALKHVQDLFSDPFFSSLWTLQESFLRQDAVILAKDAKEVLDLSTNREWRLYQLSFHCEHMIYAMHRLLETPKCSLSLTKAARALLQVIVRSGFNSSNVSVPNVQYAAAAFRQTTYPLDRVFGILQIFGLAAHEVSLQGVNLPLDELRDSFAYALMHKNPVLGQLFVHSREPAVDRSWRITEYSYVPDFLRRFDGHHHACFKACRGPVETLRIDGQACSASGLQIVWQTWHEKCRGSYAVYLDADERSQSAESKKGGRQDWDYLGRDTLPQSTLHGIDSNQELADSMTSEGRITNTSNLGSLRGMDHQVILLAKLGWHPTLLGMIIRYESSQSLWKRIGICIWDKYVYENGFQGEKIDTADQPPLVWSSICVDIH